MAENFTAKQKEIVARKMGYDGPMQMFDEYLASTPSDAQRYAAVTSKFAERMAKGGMVRKYAVGGTIEQMYQEQLGRAPDAAGLAHWQKAFGTELDAAEVALFKQTAQAERIAKGLDTPAPSPTPVNYPTIDLYKDNQFAAPSSVGGTFNTPGIAPGGTAIVPVTQPTPAPAPAPTPAPAPVASTGGAKGGQTTTPLGVVGAGVGAPTLPTAPGYEAATTTTPTPITAVSAGDTDKANADQIATAATATAPTAITANVISPTGAAAGIEGKLNLLSAEQGTLNAGAKSTAATQVPSTTAVGDLAADQAVNATVTAPVVRTAQSGETIAGATVDMTKVEQNLALTQAAQGVVTEDMTVQGQLNKLLTNFDAGKPPAWAAASMRAATAQIAARGVGASSMAGQAIIQATLEAAAPIAAADAKIQETMALQNLSNRQAVALDLGKQRAAFLGQEFDQAFQTRVKNAATISDIANRNFDATVTIALENARIANSTNLANLSAKNALVLAEAAQIASLETTNLTNTQMSAVNNAKNFLDMDIKNLDLKQQTNVFKAKIIADSLTSDAGFANAASATNASNKLEADKIFATLALTASQYNASEMNKVKVANLNAANEIVKLNAQEANDRSEFNSRLSAEINVANAKILADVSTANTAAINAANAVNAKNATDLTSSAYAQQSQTYRDLLSYSYKAGEGEKDRITQVAVASINKSALTSAAEIKTDGDTAASWGKLAYEVIKGW